MASCFLEHLIEKSPACHLLMTLGAGEGRLGQLLTPGGLEELQNPQNGSQHSDDQSILCGEFINCGYCYLAQSRG